jgi:hypothetical protein
LAALWLAAAALLAAVVSQRAVPYEDLLLDPAHVGGRPWYTGLVSNLGVLGWTTATVAAAGGGWLGRIAGRAGAAEMLRGGALLSGLLLLDDLFQLHIIVPPMVGMPQGVFSAGYVGLAGWWIIETRRELSRTRWPLLVAALGALGLSVVSDRLGSGRGAALVLEDSAKFLGILAWALFFVLTARDITGSVLAELTGARRSALPRSEPEDGREYARAEYRSRP